MQLINEYTPDSVIRNFPNLDEALKKYYDLVITNFQPRSEITPRGYEEFRITRRDIFYYISWLYDNNPASVLDWGCGDNVFSKWFPNIHAVDVTSAWSMFNRPNELAVPETFYYKNIGKFDCGMALNSLHFNSWINVKQSIHSCMEMIKDKGRFLFTLNYSHIFHQDDTVSYHDARVKMDDIVYDMLINSEYKVILFDSLAYRNIKRMGQYINGDARFILEKQI